jgi:hypothetical protein
VVRGDFNELHVKFPPTVMAEDFGSNQRTANVCEALRAKLELGFRK